VKVAAVMPQQMNKVKVIPAKKTIYPYTIQVSSYLYREKSNSIAIELRKKGDPAFTSPAYVAVEGDWYRVFIGYYGTLVETVKAASKLKERKFIYSRVVKRPYAIQVGLFDSDQELGKMGANLRSKEYVAYSIPDRTYSDKTRLLIGAFETEEEAARLTKKLQQEGFKPTVVKR
jgi:cell division septation protein DedD